ncbi:hypothetical protein M9Y10_003279 [Tritrichomonas musculus]|uniref:DUF2428 domain-containing protein n=1 Tax=Tritrichomonas musculus TaxID=1915356 RepID=A0ABR2JPK5_9EUKA
MKKVIQKLYQKLPEAYAIKPEQVRSSYQLLYDRLNDSFHKNDFNRIYNLLHCSLKSDQLLNFELPIKENDQSKGNLLLDIINLIYSIITIYPVKYYKTQLVAASFLNELLKTHKQISNLVLNWHPFYKVMQFFTFSKESFFLCGENVPHFKDEDTTKYITNFFELSNRISHYFPNEIDSNTSTTKQLVKKFIPKISPNGKYSQSNIVYFCFLCPPHKGQYKLFIDFLLLELRDTSNEQNAISLFYLINKVIQCNIEDDFSFLLPIVSQFISTQVVSEKKIKYPNHSIISPFFKSKLLPIEYSEILAKIITSLFISPPTRKAVLDLLENFFISFKNIIHPSVSENELCPIDNFSLYLVLYLKSCLKKLSKSDTRKIFFNMNKELGPSQEELHKFLSLTSEQRIMNIRNCAYPITILIETSLDPSTTDHYFEIAYQCINFMDTEENVSSSGWNIFSALMMSIDKNEKMRQNIEHIIEIAANNLYRIEIQYNIANFLHILFSKVPFNKKTTLKGLEHLNFPRLASLILSNLMSIFRSLPKPGDENEDEDESADISENVLRLISSFAYSMFENSDAEVKEELVPIFVSLATDEDIAPKYEYFEDIVCNFTLNATFKQAETISKAFEKQIELRKHNSVMFSYLAKIYASILPPNLKTVESVKHVIDVIFPFTKDKDRKIRMAAWDSISSALRTSDCICNFKVQIKSEKIKENPFENARLEDFDIIWNPKPDLSNLAFEIFDPIYEKLLTIKDPHEINELLKEIKKPLSFYFVTCNAFTEGSIDNEVDEFFTDPIYNVSAFYRKSFPIKDKFVKCALRIINEFCDQENLISNINEICSNLFIVLSQSDAETDPPSQLRNYYIPFDYSSPFYNKSVINDWLYCTYSKRRSQFLIHINDDIRKLITANIELSMSNYESINEYSNVTLFTLCPYYKPLLITIFENIVKKANPKQFDEFVKFLGMMSVCDVLEQDYELCCKILIIILKSNLKNKDRLPNLKRFMSLMCISSLPSESPKSNEKEFVDLLNEIENNYLNKNPNNRTYNYFIILIIYMCLKRVYNVSDSVFEYVMKSVTHFDEKNSEIGESCLTCILERRSKFTKEKVEVTNYPTIPSFPNILDQVSIKLEENGNYFPSLNFENNNKKEEEIILSEEEEEEEEEFKEEEEEKYSLNSNPANVLSLSNKNRNEEIKKVFESYENIEIEWTDNDSYNLFNSEFLFDQSNGFFQFKDHYHHKKYEFIKDQFLIENIGNLLASASNSINEKSMKSNIKYCNIWDRYAITVGPYSTKEINKNCIKYMSEYYSNNSIVVSKVLHELILSFIGKIFYWNKEDQIEFIKLVVLPVVCIFSSNPNTISFASSIITRANFLVNPFCFAPLIKVLFCLSSEKPNLHVHNRSLIMFLANQISLRTFHFYNSIDQFNEKFIKLFIINMSEYNSNEVESMIKLIFSFIFSTSFLNKESPLYSKEIESKLNSFLNIFDDFLKQKIETNPSMKRNFIHALTFSLSLFELSSYDVRISVLPLFMKHMHTILNLLNSSNINEEEQFIKSTGSLIENSIFFMNNEIELKFVSLLVNEMMNLSLPMQLILLENLNKMIEGNIFNIPKNDYPEYERILLKYGNFVKTKNYGNDLRLKIAKILGIFEIRKSDNDTVDEKQNCIDDEVMISASIILNSFLFDRGDERVTKAFNLMEEHCTSKKSKNIEFFKSVSEIFTRRHVDHVLNEVQDLIIQCMGSLAPSYIC